METFPSGSQSKEDGSTEVHHCFVGLTLHRYITNRRSTVLLWYTGSRDLESQQRAAHSEEYAAAPALTRACGD